MHPVGDGYDGHLIFRQRWKYISPHLAGDFAVQCADSVNMVGQPQGQHGHTEIFLVVLRFLPPQAQKLFPAQIQRARIIAEVPIHQLRRKHVVARRYRRMGSKYIPGRRSLRGLSKVNLLSFHESADTF